jgi:hypothetical protein
MVVYVAIVEREVRRRRRPRAKRLSHFGRPARVRVSVADGVMGTVQLLDLPRHQSPLGGIG